MNPTPSPTTTAAVSAGPWGDFVAWAAGDPGAVATLIAAVLALLSAVVASLIAAQGNAITRAQGARSHGFERYGKAAEWIRSGDPGLVVEGARILNGLLTSNWPTHADRLMAESLMKDYTDGTISVGEVTNDGKSDRRAKRSSRSARKKP